MGMKHVLALNDEAPHCTFEKPEDPEEESAEGRRAQGSGEEQRGGASVAVGTRAVNRTLSLTRVIDLSATPFFLRGSGYAEGTLFPWTMSDSR